MKPTSANPSSLFSPHHELAPRRWLGWALAWWAGSAVAQPVDAADPAQREKTAPDMPALGTRMALPKVPLLQGGTWEPDAAQARAFVIYWWASTCPFCALQSPEMERLWQAHRARGLRMLTLSIDKKPEDATAYLAKRGYTFPAAWVSPHVHAALPKPKGLPITWVLAPDGRLLQAEKGQMFAEDVAALARWWTA